MIRNNVELRLISDVHSHHTRQQNHYYVENFQSSFGFANFFTRGLIAYIELDPQIIRIHTISRFKNELKKFRLEEYLLIGN